MLRDLKIFDAGSSPRLRGTHVDNDADGVAPRFIPAPAGNTLTGGLSVVSPSVHPRACGEHATRPLFSSSNSGSSPRLRGTPFSRRPINSNYRFIPAPAGNTFEISFKSSSIAVHPRACGEHQAGKHLGELFAGSSPRLRGTLQPRLGIPGNDRFIPAPAGNT